MDLVPATLTIDQVAAILQTSRATIYRMMKAGQIPSVRVGQLRRFSTRDLEDKLGFPILSKDLAAQTSSKLDSKE